MPQELDEISRDLMQLEIEQEALKKEHDEASRERLSRLEFEITELRRQKEELETRWKREKEEINIVQRIKEDIERTKVEIDQAERETDLARAAELKYGRLRELQSQLEAEEAKFGDGRQQEGKVLLKEEIDEEDIAEVISRWTGIPVSKLMEGEIDKLLRMEEFLHNRIVGQEQAVAVVSEAVRRARAGLKDPNRPIGSFMFLGPTGVGKTELTKALAEYLFNDENAVVRIDMTEYMEKHAVARLIGAPPGYVGYEEGGQLTEAVRRKPYSVVLFDEVEKAHPDVFNVLLQLMDDGRLTDSKGRTVDFRNTVVILTSNIGSPIILEARMKSAMGQPIGSDEQMKERVMDEVRGHFRPEFINRLDDIVFFEALCPEDLRRIVDIQLGNLRKLLAQRNITIDLTNDAKELLGTMGYDPVYGARPLKRVIRKYIENPLSSLILRGDFRDGDHILAEVEPDKPEELRFVKTQGSTATTEGGQASLRAGAKQ
jgi:ATP-dependent Clp protease ATP-binding subunit ClpB